MTTLDARVSVLEGRLARLESGVRGSPDDAEYRCPSLEASHIKEVVAEHFNITVRLMDSRTRESYIAWPRQVAMHFCRQRILSASLKQIGLFFGVKPYDHGTICHACNLVTGRMLGDKKVRDEMVVISGKIGGAK